VKYGVEFAKTYGAALHILHVSGKERLDVEMEFPLGLDGTEADASRERLLKIMTPQQLKELTPELVLRSGAPHIEIVRYAKERGIDLIVMGTHGRGFMSHAVMGSVTERVVRFAPCPVLTVRHPQHEFVMPDQTERAAARGAN